MKISDLIQSTFTTNEEAEIMKKIDKASPFEGSLPSADFLG